MADVVLAIREHVPIAEAGLRLHAHAERHLKSPTEMARLFRAWPEAIDNNVHFFSRLQFSLDELSHQYPDEIFDGESPALALRRLASCPPNAMSRLTSMSTSSTRSARR